MSLSAVDLPERNEPLNAGVRPGHDAGAHFTPARSVHLAHRVRVGCDSGDDRDVAVVAVQATRPINRDGTERRKRVGAYALRLRVAQPVARIAVPGDRVVIRSPVGAL